MNRGEIWQVVFDPTIGDEIRKTRPAVIISSDSVGVLNLRVVVPLTAWQPAFTGQPWKIHLAPNADNGLSKASAADAFQVKSISINRFLHKVGAVSPSQLQEIVNAVGVIIEHP